jgi:hypothetical protein
MRFSGRALTGSVNAASLQDMVDAAPDVVLQLGARTVHVTLHCQFEELPVIVGHRLAAKALR